MEKRMEKRMKIKEYKDKVRGCWLGKNIGGSLGAPFECIRGVYDLDFYTTDLSKGALPNDDLDLQLIWLNAAEKYGKNVTSEILAEYWTSYVVANWSEYGAGKNNVTMGLQPPISGWYNNHNKDSCGCFIRSEIWACLAPGHPEIAVEYAYRDAIVDHSDEGVYGEIFCAAMESAAFVESDKDALIRIGLSYIPVDCDITRAIETAQDCYKSGIDWKAARKVILQKYPSSFGMYEGYTDMEPEADVPTGALGYDAPSNVGLMVMAWLYGEGDFEKSICIAAGCCEDGDCTAATLGSVMGIIGGAENLPKKWLEPVGDDIKTVSLDLTNNVICVPGTITELSARVCALMPVFMGEYCDTMNDDGVEIHLKKGEELCDQIVKTGIFSRTTFRERLGHQPFGVEFSNVLYTVTLDYIDGIHITADEPKKLSLHFQNTIKKQQWVTIKWNVPSDWTVSPCVETVLNLDQYHGGSALTSCDFVITPTQLCKGKYDITAEITSNGRLSKMFVPVTLIVR